MCHHVPVTLTAEETASVKKLSGVLVPAYASIVLAVIALASLAGGPPRGDLVASVPASAPAATR